MTLETMRLQSLPFGYKLVREMCKVLMCKCNSLNRQNVHCTQLLYYICCFEVYLVYIVRWFLSHIVHFQWRVKIACQEDERRTIQPSLFWSQLLLVSISALFWSQLLLVSISVPCVNLCSLCQSLLLVSISAPCVNLCSLCQSLLCFHSLTVLRFTDSTKYLYMHSDKFVVVYS